MNKWPKIIPPLSKEQEEISNDFVLYWLQVLSKNYSFIDKFNHSYVVKNRPLNFLRTLEIGAGTGEHLNYEKLTDAQKLNYYALDIRKNIIDHLKIKHPEIQALLGDCQKNLDFSDGFFDRILAIHVLEHLPDLRAAIKEIYRLINKKDGVFSVVIPCEGSFAYSLARKVSAQRIFESRYKQSYNWFIEREHINLPSEIFEELDSKFTIINSSFFPLRMKSLFCNLCIGLTLKPRD